MPRTPPPTAPPSGALVLVLDMPEATPSNNTVKGMHYRVYGKTRQAWRARVADAILAAGYDLTATPLTRSHLEIERYSAGGGLDWDNAYGGLKPLLDCLVSASARNPDGLGLIEDDNPRAMPLPPALTQHSAKPGHGRTVVRVYAA